MLDGQTSWKRTVHCPLYVCIDDKFALTFLKHKIKWLLLTVFLLSTENIFAQTDLRVNKNLNMVKEAIDWFSLKSLFSLGPIQAVTRYKIQVVP